MPVRRRVATARDGSGLRESIVLTAFVDNAQVAFGRFVIRNDAIQFADLERSRIVSVIETDCKTNGLVFHHDPNIAAVEVLSTFEASSFHGV